MDKEHNIVNTRGVEKIFIGYSDLDEKAWDDGEVAEFEHFAPIIDSGITFKEERGKIIATWTDGGDKTITHTKVFSPYGYLADAINEFFRSVSIFGIEANTTDLTPEDKLPF